MCNFTEVHIHKTQIPTGLYTLLCHILIHVVSNLLLLYWFNGEPQYVKQLQQSSLYVTCVFLAGQMYDQY
jgi:hypothetical protein